MPAIVVVNHFKWDGWVEFLLFRLSRADILIVVFVFIKPGSLAWAQQ